MLLPAAAELISLKHQMAQILLLANNKLVLASCCWFTVKWQMLLEETLLPRVPSSGAKTKKGLVEQAEHWKGSGADGFVIPVVSPAVPGSEPCP